MFIRYCFVFLVVCFFLCCVNVWASGYFDDRSMSVSVRIEIKKDIVKVGEEVKGKVILENANPASLPVTFTIRLFHDDQLFTQVTTAIKKLPSGFTGFSFQKFGIPQFNKAKDSAGVWRISIVQIDRDIKYSKEIVLTVKK